MVQIKVNEGMLEGDFVINEYGGTFYSFKGIPYASPPIGHNRFQVRTRVLALSFFINLHMLYRTNRIKVDGTVLEINITASPILR